MSRLSLLHQMDRLLEKCKVCDKPPGNHQVRCNGCSVYNDLQIIGKSLGRKKEMAKAKLEMTVDEFVRLTHVERKSKSEVAKLKGVSEGTIYYWMNNNEVAIKAALAKASLNQAQEPEEMKKTPAKIPTIKLDVNANLRQLNDDLMNELKQKGEWIEKLQKEIRDLKNVHAACSDIEDESNSLQEELTLEREAKQQVQTNFDRVQTELEIKDYELQNLLHKHADLYSSLLQSEKENRALRKLVQVYVEKRV
jgi:transposase-like protein